MSKSLNLVGGPLCLVECREVRGVRDGAGFREEEELEAGGFLIGGGVLAGLPIVQRRLSRIVEGGEDETRAST